MFYVSHNKYGKVLYIRGFQPSSWSPVCWSLNILLSITHTMHVRFCLAHMLDQSCEALVKLSWQHLHIFNVTRSKFQFRDLVFSVLQVLQRHSSSAGPGVSGCCHCLCPVWGGCKASEQSVAHWLRTLPSCSEEMTNVDTVGSVTQMTVPLTPGWVHWVRQPSAWGGGELSSQEVFWCTAYYLCFCQAHTFKIVLPSCTFHLMQNHATVFTFIILVTQIQSPL